ncbi:SCO family protein [Paraburkholderia oxyphila]|uniref:SCO family protein n=1 Tax=Paraburkholderia oxyphila TaxID=614212 RepID=UPI001428A1EF|nr:SCO family protein [Paraburkholderia oxyphila]
MSESRDSALCRSLSRAALTCILLALALYGYAVLGRHDTYAGTRVAQIAAPPLALQSVQGGAFSWNAMRGKAVLVYFGYTRCPDVCPSTLAALLHVMDRLGAAASHVAIVFVTLDPQHDSPARLRDYLAQFSPAIVGLSGPPAEVAQAAADWGITWRRAEDGRYIDHTSVVTLVDPQGRLRLRYGYGQLGDPAAMAGDIRHVVRQQSGWTE